MSYKMQRSIISGFAASMLCSTALAAELNLSNSTHNWSGFYIGGGVSASISNSETELEYGAHNRGYDDGQVIVNVDRYGYLEGGDLIGQFGWHPSGQFAGSAYDGAKSLQLSNTGGSGIASGTSSSGFLRDYSAFASRWIDAIIDNDARAGANLLIGYQHHTNQDLVLGIEAQISFTNYDHHHVYQWSEAGSRSEFLSIYGSGGGDDIDINGLNYSTDSGVSSTCNAYDIYGCSITNYNTIALDAEFLQSNALAVNVEMGPVIAPVLRIGGVHGRFQLFGFAGPAVSRVKLETSARVAESSSFGWQSTIGASVNNGDLTSNIFDGAGAGVGGYDYFANWQGETEKWLTGYRVGAGAEYAATDNLILRLAYDYTDLGGINVVAVSDRSDAASYSVQNEIANHNLTVGVLFKF